MPLYLAALFIAIFLLIKFTQPSAPRSSQYQPPSIEVNVQTIKPETFQVTVNSYGFVEALTRTTLTTRVSGEVTFIDDSFRLGGLFTKNQLLVSLDKSDYTIEFDIAMAKVAEAQSRYASEKAQAEEARHDWKRSGRKGEAPALAVRQPQLDAATAALKSAEASVARASLNLSRTEIRAPYNGSVIQHFIGLGQYVSQNTPLGEIFSHEAAEIPLPIKNSELHLLGLDITQGNGLSKGNSVPVTITSTLFSKNIWSGKIVRVASAINEQNRQLNIIARIPSPFNHQSEGHAPLKVGEYVTATIKGKTLKNAIIIPSSSIYQGRYVFVYKDGRIYRQDISSVWSDKGFALIESGLTEGEQLVISSLGQVSSGTSAKLIADKHLQTKQNGATRAP